MELRHLRYFIAVAETGSLTVAAEKRLHTAQPSSVVAHTHSPIRGSAQVDNPKRFRRGPGGLRLSLAGGVPRLCSRKDHYRSVFGKFG